MQNLEKYSSCMYIEKSKENSEPKAKKISQKREETYQERVEEQKQIIKKT